MHDGLLMPNEGAARSGNHRKEGGVWLRERDLPDLCDGTNE